LWTGRYNIRGGNDGGCLLRLGISDWHCCWFDTWNRDNERRNIMSDIHSEQYWERFWDDYPEQVSKDLEDRKVEFYLDLIARELDYVEPSTETIKHRVLMYDLIDDMRRELTRMKEGRHRNAPISTYRIAK
tara:strand:+ start:3492 stop:3884 length:393 start_codon:yes stop_codon:yes gene_type:complete